MCRALVVKSKNNMLTTESLLNNVKAYVKSFETNTSTEDIPAIASSILTFKLNVMQSSPAPSKSNEEIAAEVDSEVDRFKASRSSTPISFSF